MISVSYILLCGQILLLLTVILLQCLDGIHSQNSSTAAEPSVAPTGQGSSTTGPFADQPTEEARYDLAGESSNHTQLYEYRPPSPVVLCSYL